MGKGLLGFSLSSLVVNVANCQRTATASGTACDTHTLCCAITVRVARRIVVSSHSQSLVQVGKMKPSAGHSTIDSPRGLAAQCDGVSSHCTTPRTTRSHTRRLWTQRWTDLPECVTAGVLEHLWKWQPRSASVHFRLVCKSWQVAHDGLLRSIRIRSCASMPTTAAAWKRLSAVVSLQVDSSQRTTEVDAGVRSLAPLTALTSLEVTGCAVITDAGLRSLAPLTALTSLRVYGCTGIRHRTLVDLLSFIRSSLIT